MQKKYFILTTIIGALLIFSLLPILNYKTDPSRILHRDYKTRYKKFHPHKLFLKVAYLLDHKNQYDTLVYGSSRGGFMDVSLISKDAYNMSHGFGTVTTYLHSLKSLLNNGVEVKNVWIGINDFVIWKDHTDSLPRLINHNSILKNLEIYSYWLFRFIPESLNIFKNNTPLIQTTEVTNPHDRIVRARVQEKPIKGANRNILAAPLGYTGQFRIDKAIDEINQIKKLCDEHNITLTAFIYPTYYKTYLRYDQSKMEEFKRKLVSIVDFYDFYHLGDIATNQDNWFEGSHFVPSIGDYIIKNIQKNNFLVTQKNIEAHLTQIHPSIKNFNTLPSNSIFHINPSFNLDDYPIIFDINNSKFRYIKNDEVSFKKDKDTIIATVTQNDPQIILNQTKTKLKHTVLSFSMISTKATQFQIYLKKEKTSKYLENYKHSVHIKKGFNQFRLMIPGEYINNSLRVDFVKDIGVYKIKEFKIRTF